MEKLFIQNCSKSYGRRTVLRDVSVSIPKGKVIGLLGPNGAGKTTCFNIIAGVVKTDTGKVCINNIDITTASIHNRAKFGISYLPQDPSIFRGMTVEENILAVLEFIIKEPDERIEKLEELLKDFDIVHLSQSYATALSGGERRRLEIARTIATNPKFILLDEPLAGIDPIAIMDLKNIILKLQKSGMGILITDHNVREVIDIVEYIYIIYDGQVLIQGPTQEVIQNKLVQDLYLGNRI